MAILSALHEKPWRIVHLAAHGVFQFIPAPGESPVTGLVLDDGVFFTVADAGQMRHVPDLIFINCCHLGQTQGEAPPQGFYALVNRLAAEVVQSWKPRGSAEQQTQAAASLDAGLILLNAVATELSQSSPAFFDLAACADHNLLKALRSWAFDASTRQDVEAAYVQAGLRGVSRRNRASMRDQMAFFEAMARPELTGAKRKNLVSELTLLGQSLGA